MLDTLQYSCSKSSVLFCRSWLSGTWSWILVSSSRVPGPKFQVSGCRSHVFGSSPLRNYCKVWQLIIAKWDEQNLKQTSCVKSSKLTVLCKYYFACLVYLKNWLYKAFVFGYWKFFNNILFVSQSRLFWETWISTERAESKRNFFRWSCGHNILELCKVLV